MASSKAELTDPAKRRQLRWLTLYEGAASLERTRELGLQVARNVKDLMGVTFENAALADLTQEETNEFVTRAALKSDVILVSVDESGPALEQLPDWLGMWSGKRVRTDGLFAVWLGPGFANRALPQSLQQSIAREVERAGMECLFRVMGVDTGVIGPGDTMNPEMFNPLLGELSNRLPPPSHWGINE